MKYLMCLLLAGCAINIDVPKKVEVEDVHVKHEIKIDNPVLQTCMVKLEKTDIDEDILNCYYETIKELQNEHRPKDY